MYNHQQGLLDLEQSAGRLGHDSRVDKKADIGALFIHFGMIKCEIDCCWDPVRL